MRAFVRNSGWLLFDRVVRMLLGLVVGAMVARYLGPSEYGQLSYVIAYVAVFMAAANMGGDGITVRDISRDPRRAHDVLGSATATRALVGSVALLVAVTSMLLIHDQGKLMAWLTLLVGASLVLQAFDTVDLWFQSQLESRRTVIAKLVAYLTASAAKVALIASEAPLWAFAAVLALDAALSAVALGVAYRGFPTTQSWRLSVAQVRAFLVEVWPFLVGGLLVVAYMRVDQITVGRLLGERQLGLYAAAVWLLQVWYVIPMTLATSLGPYVARRKAADEFAYRRAVMLASRAFFYAGLAGALVTVLAGPLAVRLVFGEEYSEAGPLLQAYSLTMPLYFLSLAHNLWLINEGRYLIRVYGAILAGLVTVGLIVLLAPRLGVMSACVAAIAAQLVGSLLINALLDRPAFRLQIQAITFR